ncbi:MAG: hypothetical protein KAR20_08115, partial [Candidatus Heimdallarchaeota archaeon]|nr:hypothetical protein [Candidatus Heimdallarchaeota archaeon]
MKFLKEINLPKGLEYGEYLLVVKLEYENKGFIDEDSFDIIFGDVETVSSCCLGGVCWFKFTMCWYWWVLIFVILIGTIVARLIIKHRSGDSEFKRSPSLVKPRRMFYRRPRVVGHKMSLRELVSYIIREANGKKDI